MNGWMDRRDRVSEISPFKAFDRLPLQSVTNQFIVAKIEPHEAREVYNE